MHITDCRQGRYGRVMDGSLLAEVLHPERAGMPAFGCSIARAIVREGEATLPHRLRKSAEVYYILAGAGIMHLGSASAAVRADMLVYIPPGTVQWIENTGTGDLVFLCIVDPSWQPADEELIG
ncbi:MAG: cupin domain-containing protein [Methanomicrobiales archaeon]|nr:cupin domain-containing protein [Methanomicrobiales archaeon]